MADHDRLIELETTLKQHLRSCIEAARENAKAHRWILGLLLTAIFGIIGLFIKGHV